VLDGISNRHCLHTILTNIIKEHLFIDNILTGVGPIPYDLIRIHYRGPISLPRESEMPPIDGVNIVRRYYRRTGVRRPVEKSKKKHRKCGSYRIMEQRGHMTPYGNGSFTLCYGPEFSIMPSMTMTINPSKLLLSPQDLGAIVAQYMPIESARIAYIECKLDLEHTDAKHLADAISIKWARQRQSHSSTSFSFGGKRSRERITIYDKAVQLDIDVIGLTRLEVKIRLPTKGRPTVAEFVSGCWEPRNPFAKMRLMEASGLCEVEQAARDAIADDGVHNGLKTYAQITNRGRADKAKKILLFEVPELWEAWLDLLEMWYCPVADTVDDGIVATGA